ncbi:MAG: M18 family aminopeptidase [Spirochaetota bacterium]
MEHELLARLCSYIDSSPTAWQAVETSRLLLEAAGATRLDERSAWRLEPGLQYYAIRNGSALAAFRVGLRPCAEEGFAIAAAHSDSPALKVRLGKPLSGHGMERVAVELYGSPIVSTWFDRPLGIAGRLVVKKGSGHSSRLFRSAGPLAVIPNLAIHLNRELNKGFEYNAQGHLPALFASRGAGVTGTTELEHPAFLRLIADEAGVGADAIISADLFLVEPGPVASIGDDLINGPRLDNLLGCHAVLKAFLAATPRAHGQFAFLFDSEEIGSRTRMGGDSAFLRDILGRVAVLQGAGTEGFYRALAGSFMVSVDVAQAWHPGWPEKFDEAFAPLLNGGPAIKANANYRYATDATTEARFRSICESHDLPCQTYMSRADIAPGSTIGPMSSALTGIATVDVGSPLLSMHSIRETAGTRDHSLMAQALQGHLDSSPVPHG